MTIRARISLLTVVAACAALAACSNNGPTSPTSDPAATGSSGAVIEGTVTGGGGQSAGVKTDAPATGGPGLRPLANSPMAGVIVRVVGTNLAATVTDAGTFRIADVPGGSVRLQFTSGSVNATAELGNVQGDQFIQIQVQLSGTMAVVVTEAREGKVTLCHAEGNGSYHAITVSESAEGAHRGHGDAMVGEAVPGRANMTFNERCEPVGPAVEIVKSTNGEDANDAPGPEILVGTTVTWTYLLTNTGTLPLTGVAVVDDRGVVVNCGSQTTLAAGASMTCTGSGPAVLGQYANLGTVTASWSSAAGSGTVTDSDPSHYLGILPAEEEEGPKVTLCHRTGAGFYVMINVSVNAEPAHRGHGDGRIGEAVPNQPGRVFTSSCGVQ